MCNYHLCFLDEETGGQKVKSLGQIHTTIKWESCISNAGSQAGLCPAHLPNKQVKLICFIIQHESEREQEWKTSDIIFYLNVESEIKYDRFPEGRGYVCSSCSEYYLLLLVQFLTHSRFSSIPASGGWRKGRTEQGTKERSEGERQKEWMNEYSECPPSLAHCVFSPLFLHYFYRCLGFWNLSIHLTLG